MTATRLCARAEVRTVACAHGSGEDVARIVRPVEGEWLCLLADGLGHHGGGGLAASIAVSTLADAVGGAPVDRRALVDALPVANAAIRAAQRASPAAASMRTTLAALHVDGVSAWWLHCGDTRVYAVRGGEAVARTRDHSVAAMFGDGDDTDCPADRDRLVRSLGGNDADARPRVLETPFALRPADRFLLCTDGWWGGLDERLLLVPGAAPRDPEDDATLIDVVVFDGAVDLPLA